MKKTAVQWYAIESGKLEVERAKGYLTFSQMFDKMLEILKQAKAMEKEQIIESHFTSSGCNSFDMPTDRINSAYKAAQQYYIYTYEQDKQRKT